MTPSHRGRLVSAIGGIALALSAVAVSGAARDRLKAESESAVVTAEADRAAAKPRCDRGTRAISGGFETDADVNLRQIFVIDSERGGRRSWKVEAHNFSLDDALLTAFAYCRDERTKSRSRTVEVAGAGDARVGARCKPGTEAISGGFSDVGDPEARPLIAYESRRTSKRRWTVAASNTDGQTGALEVHVYCRKAQGLRVADRTETLSAPGPVDADVAARCRRNERVVSGGFASDTVPLPGKGRLVDITASRKGGKRKWRISVAAIGTDVAITAYAYCEGA